MLEGRRVAILADEHFEDSELTEPLRAMKDAGANVRIVGNGSKKRNRAKRGSAEVTAAATADKVEASQFDAIIVPGGYVADKMRLHQPMIDPVRKAHAEGNIVAAACHGPQLLISADIAKGCRATSWPSVAMDLKNDGAIWVDEPMVRDGSIITSRESADLPRLNKAAIDALL